MAKPKKQGSTEKKAAGKTTSKTTSSRRASGSQGDAPAKPARGGIAQLVTPSPELGAIVGAEPLTRADLTKRVWDYIKSHNLQDAQDRRQINADDQLKQVLGKDKVSMFEMTKLINQHVK